MIKVERASICGSDIQLFKWTETAKKIAQLPFIPGHEIAGTIFKVGKNVKNFKIGDKVCCENHFFCGECVVCKSGNPDICKNMG